MAKMAKDADKALGVIGHKMKIKDQIDLDFDETKLKDEQIVMEEDPNEVPSLPSQLRYKFNNKDFGLNVIAGLNLGKAYKMISDEDEEELEDEEPAEYNISPNAIRVKNKRYDRLALNEEALDYRLDKIKNAKNAILILENLFTRVTTSNYKEVLPYKEQLKFAYDKLKDPAIVKKIVALNVGAVEQEIMHYSGLNLMLKLGKMLGIEDRVVQNGSLEIGVKDSLLPKGEETVKIKLFNGSNSATTSVLEQMRRFSDTTSGYHIYVNTTAKQNGILVGETLHIDEDGTKVRKPCYYVCFGPMYEYDKKNFKRQEPYVLNKFWYKTGFEHTVLQGKPVYKIRLDFEDYAYPSKEKQDFSNLVSSVISDEIGETLSMLTDKTNELMKARVEKFVINSRRELNQLIKEEKTAKKQKVAYKKNTEGKDCQ